jgi:hypothetical protein
MPLPANFLSMGEKLEKKKQDAYVVTLERSTFVGAVTPL